MRDQVHRGYQLIALALAILLVAVACGPDQAAVSADASASRPCVGSPAPAQWNHVVVLYFENKTHEEVIGSRYAPFISRLADRCGTAYSGQPGSEASNNWHDADYKVDGTLETTYNSKPNYATYATGLSPSEHGIVNDDYSAVSDSNNIYNQLRQAGKTVKSYYDGPPSPRPCAASNFSGAYHDAIRYFTNVGGQSPDTSTFCNTHDVPLSTFMTDVESGNLPAYSVILPTNDENMHNNPIASGDDWAESFLTPLLNSDAYKAGDMAIFFLWDEDTPIPNILIAPSIRPGSKVPAPEGNPISHFSALRTWDEMLGLPPLAHAAEAPSLLPFFNGETTPGET